MKRFHTVLLLCASVAVGCTQIQDRRIEARQRRMARAAYATSPGACNGIPHSVDYRQGFEAGYYDVASGGDGCPPALPPQKYWGATYNSPLGQEHVKAWFQGYRDGAAAAKADGVASYGTIYVPEEHRNGKRNPVEIAPALNPQPLPPGTMNPVPVIGPGQQVPVVPPAPVPNVPPMSDAQKAPPLRELQPPQPPMPPPSAMAPVSKPKSTDWKLEYPTPAALKVSAEPKPLLPEVAPAMVAPPANIMKAAAEPKPSLPEAAPAIVNPAIVTPAASIDTATVQISATTETRPVAKPPEPVQLKLPELDLPAGFAPEAGLGEPKALPSR